MATIRVYRLKANPATKRPTKAAIKAAHHVLALARIRRTGIETLIESGAFHALKAVLPADVKDAAKRRRDITGDVWCFTVPVADYGRAKGSAKSLAESIRAWILKHYGDEGAALIHDDELAVVVDNDDE